MENLQPGQVQHLKIESLENEMRSELGRIFDEREEIERKIGEFIFKLELYQSHGLNFDKDSMIRGLKESVDIKDRDLFIEHLSKVLEPIIMLKLSKPEVFESVQREAQLRESGYTKLSEVLRFELRENEAQLHLAPATEFIKSAGMGAFKREVNEGLFKLAEIVITHDDIKQVTATSRITTKNPRLLEKLGFTILGVIPENERVFFPDNDGLITKALMTREDFLARYGNK